MAVAEMLPCFRHRPQGNRSLVGRFGSSRWSTSKRAACETKWAGKWTLARGPLPRLDKYTRYFSLSTQKMRQLPIAYQTTQAKGFRPYDLSLLVETLAATRPWY